MSEEDKTFFEKFILNNPFDFKQGIINHCRELDKLDVYEWVAEDELKINKLQQENQELKSQLEEYKKELEKADSITQSCIFNGKKDSSISYRKCLNMLENLKEENQELKKQLEEYDRKLFITKNELNMRQKSIDNKLNQQKEFIDWLEDWQKAIKIQHEGLNDPVRKGFLKVIMDTIEEILSEYKEIIGNNE